MATYLKWRGLLFAALTEVGGGTHLRTQHSIDILVVMIVFFSCSHVRHEDIITGDCNDNKWWITMVTHIKKLKMWNAQMMKMMTGCTGLQTWRGTLRHSVRGTWVEIFIKHPSPHHYWQQHHHHHHRCDCSPDHRSHVGCRGTSVAQLGHTPANTFCIVIIGTTCDQNSFYCLMTSFLSWSWWWRWWWLGRRW